MKEKILIVEDQFVEAHNLRLLLIQSGYTITGIARSVAQAQEMIKRERPGFVLLDIFLQGKLTGIDLARHLEADNIPFVYLSANSNEEVLSAAKATQPYGFLVKPFRERDILTTLEIARYRHEHSIEANSRKENNLKDKLAAIIDSPETPEKKLLTMGRALQPHIPFDYLTIGFNNISNGQAISFLRIGYDEYQQIGCAELSNITGLTTKELVKQLESATGEEMLFATTFQIKAKLLSALQLSGGETINCCFYSRKADACQADHNALLTRLQKTMTGIIEGILHPAIKKKEAGAAAQTATTPGFEGIVGKSHLLMNVFDLITQVAPADTSVLILGESGTGKERIADCIHQLSPRKNGPFVKVNCAALPPNLIESELFGHEKGSFTGALDKRIGKFEKANQGTIFLDEIGEMPVDLQVKLLRVLQEKYIERIGAKDITKVDVRIMAATNRNLEKEVAEGRFRLDLYYRLNVFPIELPPLRERTEDIPALAEHFMHYYSRKAGKKITGISEKLIKNMIAYHWPGNIRELENIIERSVLLTKGAIIEEGAFPATPKRVTSMDTPEDNLKTIREHERDYIITVLKKCNGRVWGTGGAAEVLNLPPSTLKSKMKKLGIRKEYIE